MLGIYYDGKSTEQHACSLLIDTRGCVQLKRNSAEAGCGSVTIPEAEVDSESITDPLTTTDPVSITDLSVSERVGTTPRFVYFPTGASFETADHQAADQLSAKIRLAAGEKASHWFVPYRWESSFRLACFAVSLMIGIGAFLVLVGIPGLSGWIAGQLPAEASSALGNGTLELLDERYFHDSKLDNTRQKQLQELFATLTPEGEDIQYQLYFRRGGLIGANAFALPNGQVVLTDELVELAESDNEIRAVLLHEIAHVVHRHSLKQLISTVSLFAIYGMVVGDLDTMNNVMVHLPVILVQSGYSREAEREADGFALNAMLASGISPKHFADIMRKLEQEKASFWFRNGSKKEGLPDEPPQETASNENSKKKDWLSYVSSHPITQERIERFENAAPLTNQ